MEEYSTFSNKEKTFREQLKGFQTQKEIFNNFASNFLKNNEYFKNMNLNESFKNWQSEFSLHNKLSLSKLDSKENNFAKGNQSMELNPKVYYLPGKHPVNKSLNFEKDLLNKTNTSLHNFYNHENIDINIKGTIK